MNLINKNSEKPASAVPLRGIKTKNSILRLKSAGEPSQRASQTFLFPTGGEAGIRTQGTIRYTRSPGVPVKPLPHLSRIFQREILDLEFRFISGREILSFSLIPKVSQSLRDFEIKICFQQILAERGRICPAPFYSNTEAGGFEPPIPITRDTGFRDRRIQPLYHASKKVWGSRAAP